MKKRKIKLPTTDGLIFLNIDLIYYIQANDIYTYVFTKDKKIQVFKSLKYLEVILSGKDFFRSHRSYMINIHKIWKLSRDGNEAIIFDNKGKCLLSRHKKSKLVDLLNKTIVINE